MEGPKAPPYLPKVGCGGDAQRAPGRSHTPPRKESKEISMTNVTSELTIGETQNPPRIFDLEQPRTDSMPIHPSHRPGYNYVLHRRHQDTQGQDGPRSSAAGMIVCMEHTGTHIDALCHQASNL